MISHDAFMWFHPRLFDDLPGDMPFPKPFSGRSGAQYLLLLAWLLQMPIRRSLEAGDAGAEVRATTG